MDRKNKIIDILEKKSLNEKDKKELELLIGDNNELRDFVSAYNQLSQIVSRSSHLNEEEISEYILHQNGMSTDDNSIVGRIPFIETHLRKCSACSEIFKALNSEYSEVEAFLSEKISRGAEAAAVADAAGAGISERRFRVPRYAFVSVIIIGLVYLSLYIISSVSVPAYYRDAEIINESEFSVNRGRATENFQNSLKALDKHDYDGAITYLQEDIRQNPDDETIFYSYYIMGLSYLETAGHDFLGLFPDYNEERAAKGAEYIKESIQKNDSGKFTNIKLNSYFYLAKASLMLKDKTSAREYLSKVIDEKGSKMDEARRLLDDLE